MRHGLERSEWVVHLLPWEPSHLLHPSLERSFAGKPVYLQIHAHTSAPEFTSFLSQTLPSPLLCDLGEQTFCTTHYNMIRSFHSMVDNREFYICLCIFFLPVNTLILLSCIYLYSPPILLPEGNVFRIWAVRCH